MNDRVAPLPPTPVAGIRFGGAEGFSEVRALPGLPVEDGPPLGTIGDLLTLARMPVVLNGELRTTPVEIVKMSRAELREYAARLFDEMGVDYHVEGS